MDFELAYTYLIKQRPFGLRSTWDPNALSSRYFIKLSICSQRSLSHSMANVATLRCFGPWTSVLGLRSSDFGPRTSVLGQSKLELGGALELPH